MRCPYCGKFDNRVIDSRLSQAGEVTRRRRECNACGKRYTTYERVEQALPLVIKQNGGREPFTRDKAMAGLRRACVKRDISAESLERIVDSLERSLSESGGNEITSKEIGERLMHALRELDQVAYVRFASVYRDFKDAHEFLQELSALLDGSRERAS
ncbi:MAG: transcriptional regulator NrdR [Myxococcota bacterium]